MLQSQTQQIAGSSNPLSTIPNDTFLFNPYYAERVLGDAQVWQIFRKELVAFSFLILFSALLLVIAAKSVEPLLDIKNIEQFGTLTEARILETYAVESGGMHQLVYQVKYRFTDTSETIFNSNQIVSAESFDQIHTGDLVPIRYFPENPALSTLTDWAQDDTTKMSSVGVGLTSLASFLSILAATWFLGAYVRREAQFFGHGQVIMGHVLTCQTHSPNTASNQGNWLTGPARMVVLSYSFCTPDGQVIKSAAHRPRTGLGNCSLPKFGDPVAVLYLNNQRYRVL